MNDISNKPNILTVDFTKSEVLKLASSGLSVYRGSTGCSDNGNNEFSIPLDTSDIDIVIFRLTQNCFEDIDSRKKSEDSKLDGPYFENIVNEVIQKNGFVVIFSEPNVTPEEFEYLGINRVGVIDLGGICTLASPGNKIYSINANGPSVQIPQYKGSQYIIISNFEIADILDRFKHDAQWMLFEGSHGLRISGITEKRHLGFKTIWPISSKNVNPCALAVYHYRDLDIKDQIHNEFGSIPTSYYTSGLLVLPDYRGNTINVAEALVHEFMTVQNPKLFPQINSWLETMMPANVQNIHDEIMIERNQADAKIEKLQKEAKDLHTKFLWLDYLLTASGDDFKDAVKSALEFLKLNVIDIDETIGENEKKREDLHLNIGKRFLGIGEAKSTKTGAKQDSIHKLTKHQNSYGHKHSTVPPKGFLFVNHSFDLASDSRHPFYQTDDVLEMLKDSRILAIDSVILHTMCQRILSDSMSIKDAQELFDSNTGVLNLP